MKHKFWIVDRFRFRITGKDPQRFVSFAAARGIRLAGLRREKTGITALAFGADHAALTALAVEGGWQLSLVRRRGPGRLLEALLARPGLAVGGILFLMLLHFLTAFVWMIDFGTLEPQAQDRMRELLAGCGITEGACMNRENLQTAQTLALQQSDIFGWITLNFTDGCLWIESTPAEYQAIREDPPLQPLYAKEAGTILAVQTQSGFTTVAPGQSVEKGQLLVDVVRLDRDGKEILQGASGKILARIEKTYTAFQPRQNTQTFLSGQYFVETQYMILGHTFLQKATPLPEGTLVQTDWEPLQLGRLRLPASRCQKTAWLREEETLTYTEETAAALAKRACRAQLYAEFPDAEIQAQQTQVESAPEGYTCTITYQFHANIASAQP